jgi:diguanylate cyclase (GGDEF)-like protein/PAS domain S-box-containing protein
METSREQLIDALQRERDLLRVLMDSIPDSIYFKDADSRFTRVNIEKARQVGAESPDDLVGKSDFDFFAPEVARRILAEEREIIRTGRPIIGKIELIEDRRGRRSWMSATKVPIHDSSDQIIGLVGVSREMTEQRESEDALRQSEAQYRTLLNHIPQRVFYKDLNSIYLAVNPACAADFGLPAEQIVGRTDYDFYPPEVAEPYHASDRLVLESGAPWESDQRTLIHGQERWVHTVKTPVLDSNGKVTGLLGIFWDITESKSAEAKLAYLSLHDPLTGLYNRAYFEEEIRRLDHRRDLSVGVVMVDVDGLKSANDRGGHATGDDLLRRTALVLRGALRANDAVARIGGDEFAALLPGADLASVEGFIERLTVALAAHNDLAPGNPLSFSIGGAAAPVGVPLMETLQRADARMYQNKEARRRGRAASEHST